MLFCETLCDKFDIFSKKKAKLLQKIEKLTKEMHTTLSFALLRSLEISSNHYKGAFNCPEASENIWYGFQPGFFHGQHICSSEIF